jgi:hypothetical protein
MSLRTPLPRPTQAGDQKPQLGAPKAGPARETKTTKKHGAPAAPGAAPKKSWR